MKRLKKLIARCHQRHANPLRQRHTSINPGIYNKGIAYEYTVHYAQGHSAKLHELEDANISFMPIGRAPENDRGPKSFDSEMYKRYSRRQTITNWEPRRWKESWGIQIYTGFPSERYGARWHDINFEYESICDAPEAVLTCIEVLVNSVVNPLLTLTDSGGIRFSCRIPEYLHPGINEEKFYIFKFKSNMSTVYLEILGENGYSRWDARNEILMGNLLDPPIVSKDLLFAPIDILRDILHETEPSDDIRRSTLSNNLRDETPFAGPLFLKTHSLDLAREALLRRGYTYLRQNNGFYHWVLNGNKESKCHVSIWERDGTVWIRAATPDFGIPIETTPITDVWDDTGIILPTSLSGLHVSDTVQSVRMGELSPLILKRSTPTLTEQKHTIKEEQILKKDDNTLEDIFENGTRIISVISETENEDFRDIIPYLPDNGFLCFNTSTPELGEQVEYHLLQRNLSSVTRWKSRSYLWEQVKELPPEERITNPFKLGNVCIDSERCDALEKKGGNPYTDICLHCPVYKECQEHGYLSQTTALKQDNTIIFPIQIGFSILNILRPQKNYLIHLTILNEYVLLINKKFMSIFLGVNYQLRCYMIGLKIGKGLH